MDACIGTGPDTGLYRAKSLPPYLPSQTRHCKFAICNTSKVALTPAAAGDCVSRPWHFTAMETDSPTEADAVLVPLVEQYEYECLLSSRNAEEGIATDSFGPAPERTLVWRHSWRKPSLFTALLQRTNTDFLFASAVRTFFT